MVGTATTYTSQVGPLVGGFVFTLSLHEASTGLRPWYPSFLRRNPPKHPPSLSELRRVPLAHSSMGLRPWSSAKADKLGGDDGPHLESVGSRRPLCIRVWSALAVKSRPRLPTSVTRPPVRSTPAIADNFSTTIRVNLNGPLVVRQKLHVGGFPSERRAFPHGDG